MEQKTSAFRLIATIIAAVIACCPIALGIIFLIYGCIFTLHFAIAYFVLPCAFFALEFYLLKSSNTKRFKSIVGILLAVVFALVSVFVFTITPLEHLLSYEGEAAVIEYDLIPSTSNLPSSSELGLPDHLEYVQFEYVHTIFTSETNYLICQYNAENYQEQKDLLHQRYLFYVPADENSYYPAFSIDDYNFRMIPYPIDLGMCFPKHMSFIATNDRTQEIVYLYFHDSDFDSTDSIENNLLNECGWEHIR